MSTQKEAVLREIAERLGDLTHTATVESDDEAGIILRVGIPAYEAARLCKGAWIDWSGGSCPVEPGTIVDVRWNNGGFSYNAPADRWGSNERSPIDFWAGPSKFGWITGYRLP